LLDLQNIILEMVAKGTSLSRVAERLCTEVEARAPGIICSMLLVEDGALRPLAAPGLPARYLEVVDGMPVGPGIGACGSAAYLGKAVAVRDIDSDPGWHDFHPIAESHGLRACWSSPVHDGEGRVIGTFAFYFREARGPSPIEERLVATCLNLCAIAITNDVWRRDHERRANADGLTGLPNRAAFNTDLATLGCDAADGGAIVIVDLDNLKVVNDSFGHQAGDTVIRMVARRLAGTSLPDRAFRLGGDEFAIIVQSPDHLEDLDQFAQSLLEAVREPVDCGGHTVVPRATAGAAMVSPEDRTPDHARRNADFALYHAKETKRGGCVRYWPGIGSRIIRRLDSIRQLDEALRDDRVEAFYQPIVRLDTGQITGFEALCRMRNGKRMVPAAMFHEATTDAHVAMALTERMLRLVAAEARGWLDRGLPIGHLAINVSSADFQCGMLPRQLRSVLAEADVPLDCIVLEITEAVYLNQPDHLVEDAIGSLRETGVKVALDDFGTGYASLTHLLTVPVDIVKIDKSFVDRMSDGEAGRIIVDGVLHIARGLGINTIAEGIESREQAERLRQIGCTHGQGYLFARPLPAAQIPGLLVRNSGENLFAPIAERAPAVAR
jgi:diguanylate cyclase (GGDEF)-like protein